MAVARKTTRKRTVKRVTKKRTPVKRTPSAAAKRKKRTNAALEAKVEAQRISHYLRALKQKKTMKGPKVNPKVLEKRIEKARSAVAMRTGLGQLMAVQQLRDLERKAQSPVMNGNFERYEQNFIKSAASYSAKKGVEYGAWRAVGVDADVLKKAGITRTRG